MSAWLHSFAVLGLFAIVYAAACGINQAAECVLRRLRRRRRNYGVFAIEPVEGAR